MELGNFVFGHSRGAWPIPRYYYEGIFDRLVYAIHPNARWIEPFDNDVFSIRSYWWGDEEAPEATLPNFLHKPSGLEIRWYKYPFRDSYSNRAFTSGELSTIVDECIKSLRAGGA